ncbi:hypothetical protein FOCC_FOCC016378 [Frankliniella occidentalis]|nr:hypothetical protein FOCC_FOCC016378 [Frankliniella occidentalis]
MDNTHRLRMGVLNPDVLIQRLRGGVLNPDVLGELLYGSEFLRLAPHMSYSVPVVKVKAKNENTPVMKCAKKIGDPAHPSYVTLESRQESFNGWKYEDTVSSEELADAGFFCLSLADKVICFHCGGGLKDWGKGDDVWFEHALYFSKCVYVKERKGSDYMRSVKGERPATMTVKEIQALAEKENNDGDSGHGSEEESDESVKCKICFRDDLGAVFLPCRHLASCSKCASVFKKCFICRKDIISVVHIYLS